MFDKILAVVLVCVLLHACNDTSKTCVVPTQTAPASTVQVEKVDDKVAEVIIETAPREYIMDCMVHLQASEEYCKNNWFSKE
jgi:hypothetical protein